MARPCADPDHPDYANDDPTWDQEAPPMSPDDATPPRKPWECPQALFTGQYHMGDRYCGLCGLPMLWRCRRDHESPLWARYCLTCGDPQGDPGRRV